MNVERGFKLIGMQKERRRERLHSDWQFHTRASTVIKLQRNVEARLCLLFFSFVFFFSSPLTDHGSFQLAWPILACKTICPVLLATTLSLLSLEWKMRQLVFTSSRFILKGSRARRNKSSYVKSRLEGKNVEIYLLDLHRDKAWWKHRLSEFWLL